MIEVETIEDLLLGDTAIIVSSNCVLSRLWRLSLIQLGVTAARWDTMITDYIEKCKSAMEAGKANNLKGNLSKALAKDGLTWRYFCRGVTVYNFDSVKLKLDFEWENGDTTECIVRIPPVFENIADTDALTADDSRYILGYLWRNIAEKYPKLLDTWQEDFKEYCQNCHEFNNEDIVSLRTNLPRALGDDQMTWATFYRGINIIKPKSLKLTLLFGYDGTEEERTISLTMKS